MKAKVTGVSAWQGTPTGGTLSIRVPRYVDSSGNATVEEYVGWLDVNHTPPRWMDGIDHTRELYVIVQGPDDPPGVRGHFYEVLEYGPTKAVRTEFTRKMISSDLDGLIFDYAAPEPTEIPVGFGDAPLTMRAAQQVIEQGGAVVSEWSDIKVDIAQSEAARKAQQASNNNQQTANNTQTAAAAQGIYQAAAYAYSLASTQSLASISNPVNNATALIFTSGDVYQYTSGPGWQWIYNLWDKHNVKPNEVVLPPRRGKRPTLTFVMDDGPATDFSVVKPILDKYGVKGSFAVNPGSIRSGGWDQYRQLQAEGHEIMSHSLTHTNQTTLSAAALDDDMRRSRDLIRAQGLRCDAYVYPYNAHNATVRAACRKYYRGAASGGGKIHTGKPLAQYDVGRYTITNTGTLDTYKTWVDGAKTANGWAVVLIHAGYDLNADQQANLDAMIAYAQAQGVTISTFSEGLDTFGNMLDGGDTSAGLDSEGMLFGSVSGLPMTVRTGSGMNSLEDGTALNADTPPSAFANGKISWYVVDVSSKPGFGPGSATVGVAGTLMVSRVRNNTGDTYAQWDRQVFYEYNNNKIWTRRAASLSTWTPWSEVGAGGGTASSAVHVVLTYNALTSDAAYTAYPDKQVSMFIHNSSAVGWPTTAGTVVTDRTGTLASGSTPSWIRQTHYDYYTDAIRQRRVAADGTWTPWVRIDAASVSGGGAATSTTVVQPVNYKTATAPYTEFANSVITVYPVNAPGNAGFPTTAGTVYVDRTSGSLSGGNTLSWVRQTFYDYHTDTIYQRRALTDTTWSTWDIVSSAVRVDTVGTHTFDSAPQDYTAGKLNIEHVYTAGNPSGGGALAGSPLPGVSGKLTTDRTRPDTSYWTVTKQTFAVDNSPAIYTRHAATATTWGAWARIDAPGLPIYVARDSATFLASTAPNALPARLQYSQVAGSQSSADTAGVYPTTGGGTLISEGVTVANGANRAWTRQFWWPYGTPEVWFRTATSDTAWGAWERTMRTPTMPITQAWAAVSVPAGAAVTQAVTVTGATTGDNVTATLDSDLELGLILMPPRVTATNTVTLRIYNHTGAAINMAARNWKVMVIR